MNNNNGAPRPNRNASGNNSNFRRNNFRSDRNRNNQGNRDFNRKNNFSRGNFYGQRKSRFQGENIDISRFINKAKQLEEEKYVPVNKFTNFPLASTILNNITSKGYENPTPIQDQAILPILEGKDVIGIANTGTGKTAAFLLPLIDKVIRNKSNKVLIIVPTRELAMQIKDEFMTFTKGIDTFAVLCIGGADIRRQMENLKRQHNFVIGTPGRLKDLSNRRNLRVSDFNNIVLDEVDRMLDMGFQEDIKFLIDQMKTERQSLFFSATMKPKLEPIAKSFLKDPITISVRTRETSSHVEQDIVQVSSGNKVDVLAEMLKKDEYKKVLIFGRTKHGVDKLQDNLFKRGIQAESIHGDKSQFKRQKALTSFKTNKSKVLIATDVAARGLDIPNVTHVINYDVPATYEDYVHRIGRTGRGENTGIAITFIEK